MPEESHRIIIDTNLWVSFLLTKDFSKLDRFLFNQDVVLIFSQELLDEFIEVSQRAKFRKYFSLDDLTELVDQLNQQVQFASITSDIKICRDPKDNFLLSLAKDAAATHLITGDKDLLVLEKFGETIITTITDYLS